jgi:hypothetical protein
MMLRYVDPYDDWMYVHIDNASAAAFVGCRILEIADILLRNRGELVNVLHILLILR